MSRSSMYWARSSSSISASSALICWARVSFCAVGGAGVVGAEVVSGGVASSGELASLVLTGGVVFLGQFLARCPCKRHLKHRPSLASWVRSSGVNFVNLVVVVVASTSIGTCWEFEGAVCQGWVWVVV